MTTIDKPTPRPRGTPRPCQVTVPMTPDELALLDGLTEMHNASRAAVMRWLVAREATEMS